MCKRCEDGGRHRRSPHYPGDILHMQWCQECQSVGVDKHDTIDASANGDNMMPHRSPGFTARDREGRKYAKPKTHAQRRAQVLRQRRDIRESNRR